MPELPEVQTIASILRQGSREQPSLLGKQVAGARVLWERSLAEPEPEEFAQRIVGQRVEEITRRGKFIVIALSKDYLLFHLRMSGDLMVEREAAPLLPHHRLTLNLEGGWRLAFNDPRKFGRAWLVRDAQLVLSGLGPEPLDERLTPIELFDKLQKRRRRLKPLLMDQSFLAGIGNIYADEILHAARLHPLRLSDSLTYAEAERLWHSIRQVLNEGIQRNGASIDWVYRGGGFQNYFRVYQRTGQPCYVCGAPVQRIIVAQRGTHLCPVCQPMPAEAVD